MKQKPKKKKQNDICQEPEGKYEKCTNGISCGRKMKIECEGSGK